MNVIKRYWIWDEKFNQSGFKLGLPVEPYIEQGILFKKNENDSYYSGKEGIPWKVFISQEGNIESIYFRERLPDFGKEHNWDLDFDDLEKNLNEIMKPTSEENSQNDVLSIVFRDFFVAVVRISRGAFNN